MAMNRLRLAEPPASADGLVELLIAVGKAQEYHIMTTLEIEPESEHDALCDQDPDLSVKKI